MQKNDTDSLVIPRLTANNYPDSTHWGIDAIKLSFPVNCELSLPLDAPWERRSGRNTKDGFPTYFWVRDIECGQDTMKVFVWEINQTCTIDFNPAHVVFGDTEQLLSPEHLERVVQQAIEATLLVPTYSDISEHGEIVWRHNWRDHVSIQEIECSFNFEVPITSQCLVEGALKSIPAPRGLMRVEIARNGSFTVENRSKSVGKDMIYNKTAELGSRGKLPDVPDEVTLYRFETRLKSKRLDKSGLKDLSEITPTRVWNAIMTRFEASGWDHPMASLGALMNNLVECDYRAIERLLGFSEAKRLGLDSKLEIGARRAREREAAALNFPLGTPLSELGEQSMRIDAATGRLVCIR